MEYVVSVSLSTGKFYASDEKIHGFVLFVKNLNDALRFNSIASARLFIKQENLSTRNHIIERIDENELR